MIPQDDSESQPLRSFLESGGELVGNASGAAIGFVLGGPAGAVGGTVAGSVLSQLLRRGAGEFAVRALGHREQTRVASTLEFAAVRVSEKLALGSEPRSDGFFTGESGNRSFADEIVEGVLIASQREHEEKKLTYLGNLLANIAFDPTINRTYANLLVRHAEQLSYTQLCLLRLFVVKDRFNLRLSSYKDFEEAFSGALIALLQEVYDLYSRNFISRAGSAMLGVRDVSPRATSIQGAGATMHNLMELRRIGDDELLPIALVLA
jgi:hypothetical protein